MEIEIPPEKVLEAKIEGQSTSIHGQEAHHVLEPHLPPEKMLVAAPGEVIGQSASEIPLVLHVSKEDIWACPACLGIWVAEDLPYTQARIKEMPQTAPFWSGVKCLFCGGCRFTHPGTSETSWQGKWRPYLCTTIFEYVGSHAFWEAHTRKYVLTLPPLFGTTPAYMGWEIRLPSWLENPWHFDLHDPRVRRYPDSFSSPHCTVTARVTCTDWYTKGLGFLAVTFEQDETDQAPTLSGYVKWYAQMDPESVQGGGLSPLLPGIRRVYMIQVEWGRMTNKMAESPLSCCPLLSRNSQGQKILPKESGPQNLTPLGIKRPHIPRGEGIMSKILRLWRASLFCLLRLPLRHIPLTHLKMPPIWTGKMGVGHKIIWWMRRGPPKMCRRQDNHGMAFQCNIQALPGYPHQ